MRDAYPKWLLKTSCWNIISYETHRNAVQINENTKLLFRCGVTSRHTSFSLFRLLSLKYQRHNNIYSGNGHTNSYKWRTKTWLSKHFELFSGLGRDDVRFHLTLLCVLVNSHKTLIIKKNSLHDQERPQKIFTRGSTNFFFDNQYLVYLQDFKNYLQLTFLWLYFINNLFIRIVFFNMMIYPYHTITLKFQTILFIRIDILHSSPIILRFNLSLN